jgi:superfamily I DNA and RNA helicase
LCVELTSKHNLSFFYCNLETTSNLKAYEKLIKDLQEYSRLESTMVYVLNRPLGATKFEYSFKDGVVVIIPNYKVVFMNLIETSGDFEEYYDDFIDDVGYLSWNYGYKTKLGRINKEREKYFGKYLYNSTEFNLGDFLKVNKVSDKVERHNIELITSLISGSINDINVVGNLAETRLEKVRNSIVLFDGDQSRCLYDKSTRCKVVSIRGLAGTGKTQLLLNKLTLLYTTQPESKIALTSGSRVLVDKLRQRIPKFFDRNTVKEQIKWDKRLFVLPCKGDSQDNRKGIYEYVCNFYGVAYNGTDIDFEGACTRVTSLIGKIKEQEFCFDHMLLDESQDLGQAFIDLCSKVTKYTVYMFGDVNQNTLGVRPTKVMTADHTLTNCYRTDPRTLMFAYGVGLGLFERDKPQNIKVQERTLVDSGFICNETNNTYRVSRNKIKKFDNKKESMLIVPTPKDGYLKYIIGTIRGIEQDNPDIQPKDIAIVFLEVDAGNIDTLCNLIKKEFGWQAHKSVEHTNNKNSILISGRNDIKGLEFPFILCVTEGLISTESIIRNSIYLILTRASLECYLLIQDTNEVLIKDLKKGLESINKNNNIHLLETPS